MEKRTSPESNESIGHIYAEFIDNGEFKAVTNTEADFSMFELTLLTPNTATFKISPNREKLVIERPNYLAGCKKDIESGGEFLITNNAGTAHKSGDKWIVDSPLDVKIVKEKESIKETTIDGVVFKKPTLYSIPDTNGNFSGSETSNTEEAFYLIDKDGNMGLADNKMQKRAIENLDYYIVPAWEIQNIKERQNATGLKVIELGKIDPLSKKLINKGKLEFTNNNKIEYDLNKISREEIAPKINNIKESVIENKDSDNKNLERQKKIDEVYSEIMEIIRINNESLLKEKELENKLAQLIASKTKKEMVGEPAKKIEAKPFSFNIEFIKNKIQEILKSIPEIKEIIPEISATGSKNELVLNATIKAKYGVNINIFLKNAHIINNGDSIMVDKDSFSVKTDTWGTEGTVKKLIASNIDMLGYKIKEIIEKEVGKKVEKVWIENGELKAL